MKQDFEEALGTVLDLGCSANVLLIGAPGSGRSNAARLISSAIHSKEETEFIICAQNAGEWGGQISASSPAGYVLALDAAESERERRAGLLRLAQVDHVDRLPDPPAHLVLVVEEVESVHDLLPNPVLAKQYRTLLRRLVCTTGAEGISLIITTRTGGGPVFDVTMRRHFDLELFFHGVPAAVWGLSSEIESALPTLAVSTAHSLSHGATVVFPPAPAMPLLPICHVYREDLPRTA